MTQTKVPMEGAKTTVTARNIKSKVERRTHKRAMSLRRRLQLLFVAMAVLPTLVLMAFSVLFYVLIIDAWFSKRIDTALNESVAVAQAYVKEHQNIIRADALAMARDLNRQSSILAIDPQKLINQLQGQAVLRSLSGALLVDSLGNTIAFAGYTDILERDLSAKTIQATQNVRLFRKDDIVSALVPLDRYLDTYLFISRRVDPLALQAAARSTEAASDFQKAKQRRKSLQYILGLSLLVVSFFLVGIAFLLANKLSKSITRPIRNLVETSRAVREGDLQAQTPLYHRKDELRTLTVAFNRMTRQLYRQQRDLLVANHDAEERRQFIEVIFKGVSSGIISLSKQGAIQLYNDAAKVLLFDKAVFIQDILPEADTLLAQVTKDGYLQKQLILDNRHLLIRLTAEQGADAEIFGYVLTFDDITDLARAQKTAAWVDVAKRLAHEIKNPLTPIQLSAERLQRKFQPAENPELFDSLINTITRQVDDMQRLLNEFSAFARMPRADRQPIDLVELCSDVVIAYPEAKLSTLHSKLLFEADAGLLRQALINLIKNAQEADGTKIIVSLQLVEGFIEILIQDNGIGFKEPDKMEEFLEPYVTTKEKGTGLGLAIVKKIVEEHGGVLKMQPLYNKTDKAATDDTPDSTPQNGTIVTLRFAELNKKNK